MVAIWPPNVPPKPQRSGLAFEEESNRVSFKPDVGPVIERKRATAVGARFNCRFLFTREQARNFRIWWQDEIAYGSLPFEWIDPVVGLTAQFRITSEPIYSPPSMSRFWVVDVEMYRFPGYVPGLRPPVIGLSALSFPMLSVSSAGEMLREDADAEVELELLMLTMGASGLVVSDAEGEGAPVFPMLTLSGVGISSTTVFGLASTVMPMLTMASAGLETIAGTAAPSAPMLTTAASGVMDDSETPVSATLVSSFVDGSVVGSVYTFTDVDLGTPGADRFIVVAVGYAASSGTTVTTDCTINGVSGTALYLSGEIGDRRTDFWGAIVPSDASGDVVVTFSAPPSTGSTSVPRVCSWQLEGADETSTIVSQRAGSSSGSATLNINVPANGAVLAAIAGNGNGNKTWTGLTEDTDGNGRSAAHDEFVSAVTGHTVTCTSSTSTNSFILGAISIAPA